MDLKTLQKFCHTWSSKFETPFNNRGSTYATDGYVLLKVPGCIADRELSKDLFQEGVIDDQFAGPFEDSRPLSEFLTEVKKEICTACNGTGKITECPECEGSGEIELDSGYNLYSVECQTCYGTGYIEDDEGAEICDNCDGTGETSKRTLVQIGSQSFDNRLLNKLIENLPEGTTIAPSCNHNKGALVSWSEGQGLIMPVRV